VLGEWDKLEKETIQDRIQISTEFIKGFTTIGIGLTMTNWNNK
jgi:PTH1 family peptidyl-tRNA hydrolase